jgi:hypothetical protein
MEPAPLKVVGHGAEQMRFVCYARIPETGRRIAQGMSLAGPGPREECGYATFQGDGGYFLFTCDAQWHVMWDSWSADLETCKLKDVQWMEVT